MGRIGVRAVTSHAARFIMSVLAVALGVAFVTGTFALRQMLSSTFDEIVGAAATGDAYVRTAGDSPTDLTSTGTTAGGVPLSALDGIRAVDGVRLAFPDISGPVTLVGADGTAVRSTQAPSFASPYWADDPSYAHIEGRGPRDASEVMLEKHTLESSGLHIGDRTHLVVLGKATEVTVVGEADFAAPMAGATIVLLDEATMRAAFAPTGTVPSISVYAQPGVSQAELVQRLQSAAPAGSEVVTGDALRQQTKDDIAGQLGFISTFLLVFALLALFVGAFIIANTFTMSVRQRMREFALLRAVGASPAQVFSSIVVQAAVVGLAGSALGVLGGFGLVEGIGAVLRRMDMTLSNRVPLSVSTVLVGLVVGTVVSIAAAALPARRAALVPPVEAMRDEVTVHERSLHRRAWAGLALLVAGVGAIVVAVVRPDADRAGLLLGLGAAGVVVGVLVVGPVVVPTVVRWLAAPAVAWWRPVGRLARGNVVCNPRRAASTAGALTIGMALVGAAAVLATSTEASVRHVVTSEMHADYVLRTDMPDTIAPEVVAQVKALPDVASVYGLPWAQASVVSGGRTTSDALVGVDPAMLGTVLTPQTLTGPVADALSRGEAAVDTQTATDRGWAVGDEVTVKTAAGERTLTIGGLFHSVAIDAQFLTSPATLDALVPPDQQTDTTVSVVAAPGANVAGLRTELADIVKPYYVVSVMNSDEFVAGLASQVNQVLGILYALLGLSIVIAVLGIVNTLALSVIERTREIGLLRAVGLGRLQLAGTITTESVLTAVCGTVVGLVTGVGLASALPRIFHDDGLSQLAVPVGSLLGMLALAVLVGVAAAVWPAARAARLPVLDAISQE
ncbi:MAG TPA: FtsX-like permease family protein [Cellulomonas sp.]